MGVQAHRCLAGSLELKERKIYGYDSADMDGFVILVL